MKANVKVSGFTMVELLVVIAIIMVLIGIVMPAVVKSQQRAREVTCYANLKKLAVAMELYNQAEGGYPINNAEFPPLVAYLGEKVRCYRHTSSGSPHYFVQAPHALWRFIGRHEGREECFEKRASAWPVAYDLNHYGSTALRDTGKSIYIFARLDTSVHVVSYDAHHGREREWPCPGLSFEVNF
jgi:type II secretory pathway pseudopilin PulG